MGNKVKLYFFATPNFQVYRGYDFNGDPIGALKDGVGISVSPKKAEVLLADFPLHFSESKERPVPELDKPDKPDKPDGSVLEKALGGKDDAKTEDKENSGSPSAEK